jgi:hypothetical protein
VPAGKATDLIFGRLREARGLINDSPQAAVFRFATQRSGLLGVRAQALFQVAFPDEGDPYLAGATSGAVGLIGLKTIDVPGGHERLTKGSSNGNARSPHSWRHYAASPEKGCRK